MKLFVGGARGGETVTDPAYCRYGGDTTSFWIAGAGGEQIVVDAGTGIGSVARRMQAGVPSARALLLLFSHFHLDHMAGLPSFTPLYDPNWTVEMASRVFDDLTVEDVVSSFVAPPLWPLTLDELAAAKRFRILDGESMERPSQYGGLHVRWCVLHHPGGSTAFRIEEPATGTSLVIATDVEWAEADEEHRAALKELCATPQGADLLVFDGKCAPDNYEPYRGWGHSTWQEGIDLAQACGVKQLRITHHGPEMDDEACDARNREIQAVWTAASLARQGEEIEL